MAQANKHSLSRSGRDFDGCAHLQSKKISEVHYPKSVPKCSNNEPFKREVLVLAKPLSPDLTSFHLSHWKIRNLSPLKTKTSFKSL